MNSFKHNSFMRKLICVVLALMMFFDCGSMAFASAIDGVSELFKAGSSTGNGYNQNVVNALQALIGEEGDAGEVLDTLYAYGLVDENGNPIYDKDYTLIENGVSSTVTDEELEALALKRKAEDLLGDTISLDGAELTWEQVCTLLNIRDTVNALQDWMSTGNYFDEDGMDMMDSLAAQLAREGLDVSADTSRMSLMSANSSTVRHDTRVSFSTPTTITANNKTVTVSVTISNPQTESKYPVSFDVQAVNGTGSLSVQTKGASNATVTEAGSGIYTVNLTANKTSASFKVIYTDTDSNLRSGNRTATLQFSNIKNALFSGDKRATTLIFTRYDNSWQNRSQTFISDVTAPAVTNPWSNVKEDSILHVVSRGAYTYDGNYDKTTYITYYNTDNGKYLDPAIYPKEAGKYTDDGLGPWYTTVPSIQNSGWTVSADDTNHSTETAITFTMKKSVIDNLKNGMGNGVGYNYNAKSGHFEYRVAIDYKGVVRYEHMTPRRDYLNMSLTDTGCGVTPDGIIKNYTDNTMFGNNGLEDRVNCYYTNAVVTLEGEDKTEWISYSNATDYSVTGSVSGIEGGLDYLGHTNISLQNCRRGVSNSNSEYSDGSNKGANKYRILIYDKDDVDKLFWTGFYASISAQVRYVPKALELASISVPSGTFYSGQQVPITVKFTDSSDELKISENLKLTVNGTTLTPCSKEIGTYGSSVTFLYTVPDNCSGKISVNSLTASGDLYGADDATVLTAENLAISSKVSGTAKLRNYKDYAFTSISTSIDDNEPGYQWVTVELGQSSATAYKNWITNGGTGDISYLTDLSNEREDLKPVSELGAALSKYKKNETYYKVGSYLKNIYLSVDGGETRYPVYVVTNDEAETQMTLVSCFKPALNTGSAIRTDTIEVYLNQSDDSIDYFTGDGLNKTAPQLISVGGANKFSLTESNKVTYKVKKVVFMKPGAAVLTYPTGGSGKGSWEKQNDWSKLVDSTDDLVTYYLNLGAEEYLPTGSGIEYKTTGGAVTTIAAINPESEDITFTVGGKDEKYENVSTYTVSDAVCTGTYRVDDDQLTITATIDNSKGYTYTDEEDFLWVSSNTNVANIAMQSYSTGSSITLTAAITATGQSGKAYFTLYTRNGGLDGFAPVELCRSIELLCAPGSTPVLKVPSTTEGTPVLSAAEGAALTVNFTSTVVTVNKTVYDNTPSIFYDDISNLYTRYNINVYALDANGERIGGADASPVFTYTEDAQRGDSIVEPGSFIIPGGILKKLNNAAPSYQAEISSVAQTLDKDGNSIKDVPMTAIVNIVIVVNPPSIIIRQLSSYSYLSGQDITLNWKTENVKDYMTGTMTVSYADENGNAVTERTVDILNTNSLTLQGLTVPEGKLKRSYVISASITGDGVAPAADSCVVTVYDGDAMKILVNGENEGSTYTMDNNKRISDMADSDGVINLAGHSTSVQQLAQDTNLKELVSINYGEYVWGQLSDQIKWAVHDLDSDGNEIYHIISRDTDGNVLRSTAISLGDGAEEDTSYETNATLNYSQGGSYSNINSYSYVSYSPYSQFAISGLSDGKTRITATHASTGMNTALDVETVKLDNRFYLFRFYPKQETTVTYTNGKGETCEVKSNAQGELALYEPDTIASDVKLYSKDGSDNTYIGSIALDNLASGEQDATKLRTYPVNIARLRDVASVVIYIPGYEGKSVTIRGGVYKNGEYCENALLGTTAVAGSMKSGKEAQQFNVDENGKTTVYFNSAQFYTADEKDELDKMINGFDELEYIFELRFYNGTSSELYQPQVIYVSATADETNVARAGEKAVKLREVGNYRNTPVVNCQNLDLYDRDGNYAITKDTYESNEGIGISYQYPHCILNTEMLLWGTNTSLVDPDVTTEEFSFCFKDKDGTTPNIQVSEDCTYPFSSIPLVRNTWDMSSAVIDSWTPSNHETVMIQHSEADGVTIKDGSNPWKFTNSTATNPSTDKDKKKAQNDAIDAINSQLDPGSILGTVKDQADGKTKMAFTVLEGLTLEGGGFPVSLVVCPTEDSFAFHCVITIGYGNGDNTYASDELKDTSEDGGDKKEADEGKAKEEAEDSDPFQVKLGEYATLSVGGYVMGNLTYTPDSGKWNFVFVGGGFTSDLDFAVEWTNNFMVGPVPAVISFKIGLNLNVNIGFAITYLGENQGNDFLLTIGIMAYVDAFAGVGFDAGVAAIKLGIFGRIEVGDQFKTLVAIDWDTFTPKTYYGNKAYIQGSIGLRFSLKILFIKYTTTFASVEWGKDWKQGDFSDIEDYWDERTQGNTDGTLVVGLGGRGIDGDKSTVGNVVPYVLDEENATILYAISDSLVETRDYLKLGTSVWQGGGSEMALMALDGTNGTEKVSGLLYNGYSYAEPKYNSDGSMIVYLSDANSSEAEDTVASYALLNGTKYDNKFGIDPITYTNDVLDNDTNSAGADGKNDPVYYPLDYSVVASRGALITPERSDSRTGYGDSSLVVSGTESFTVSAWVRQKTDAGKKSGESVSNEDLANAMNSTEIYASVWDGTKWTTKALTDNSTPDMAPGVAVNGGKAVIAWRQVAGSDSANPLDFDSMDNLVYSVYDENGWSDPVMVYNGETGSIEGLETAIDAEGNIVILYSIKTSDDDDTSTDTEVMYTYIPKDAAENANKAATVRLTNNNEIDKNVDICNVTWQGKSQFIAAWYNEDANSSGDIQLRAIYADNGLPNGDMAESASAAGADGITGSFRLSAPASGASLDNLSVIWQEDADCTAPFAMSITKDGNTTYYDSEGAEIIPDSSELNKYKPTMVSKDTDGTIKEHYSTSSKSTLKAVQFYSSKSGSITTVGVTCPVEMASLEPGVAIDSFCAYNETSGKVMHAVLQASDYNGMNLDNEDTYMTQTVVQNASDKDGKDVKLMATIYTPVETTSMLTATAEYKLCDFDAASDFNDDDIVSQYDMPVQFTVTNTGTETISKVEISGINTADDVFEGLSILPGDSSSFTVYCYVPEKVSDITASVKAYTVLSVKLHGAERLPFKSKYFRLPLF